MGSLFSAFTSDGGSGLILDDDEQHAASPANVDDGNDAAVHAYFEKVAAENEKLRRVAQALEAKAAAETAAGGSAEVASPKDPPR